MKVKQLLLSLFLCSAVPAMAQQGSGQTEPTTQPDSLIVLGEEELVSRLKEIADAARVRKTTQQSATKLTAEQVELLKYQLLLNALSGSRGQTTTINSSADYDARLTRIETLLQELLQARTTTDTIRTRTNKRSRTTTPTIVDRRTQQSGTTYLPLVGQGLTDSQNPARVDTVYIQSPEDARYKALESKLDALLASDLNAGSTTSLSATDTIVELRTDTITQTIYSPIGFKRQVFFAVGSTRIGREGEATLTDVLRLMQKDSTLCLKLTGYSSPEGNAALNDRLSAARSRAVRSWLSSHGVEANRLREEQGGIDAGTDLRTLARRVDVELFK